jgi:hypothetical protein
MAHQKERSINIFTLSALIVFILYRNRSLNNEFIDSNSAKYIYRLIRRTTASVDVILNSYALFLFKLLGANTGPLDSCACNQMDKCNSK